MTAKTDRERQAALRKRRAEQGLVEIRMWVHPDDADQLRGLAAAMTDLRGAISTAQHPDQLHLEGLIV